MLKQPSESKDKKVTVKVVAELPVQPVRQVEYEDHIESYITIEEALTAILNSGAKNE